MIIYSFSDSFLFYLYSISPIALDRFKFPLILPYQTSPPAFSTLLFSSISSGLWSIDISVHLSLFQIAVLESPALAVYILFGVINVTFAVHPALNSSSAFGSLAFLNYKSSFLYSCLTIIVSIFKKVWIKAVLYFFYLKSSFSFNELIKYLPQN